MLHTIGKMAVILGIATSAFAAETGGGLQWAPDIDSARREAAASNRLVLLHFGAPWCVPCQRLERNVFSQPSFGQELNSQFVAVKVNYDSSKDLAVKLGVDRIPTDVVLTPDGRIVQKFSSPESAPQYVSALIQVAATARPATNQIAAQQAAEKSVVNSMQSPAIATNPTDRYAGMFGATTQQQNTVTQPAALAAAAESPRDRYSDILAPQSSTPAAAAPSVAAGSGFAEPPLQAQSPAPGIPAASAPAPKTQFAFDGYCPVTLVHNKVWQTGDTRYGANHRGHTYLFASSQAQQTFLANPDLYAPALGGDDPVIAIDEGRVTAGHRQYGVFYEGRIFLFNSENSLDRFRAEPGRYAAEVTQARR